MTTHYGFFAIVTVGILGVASVQATADDRIPIDEHDRMLEHASGFGFTHYEEIEAKSRDSVEIEGWLGDEWRAEIRFSMSDGSSMEEKRERLISGPWGMSADDVRAALAAAANEGMIAFEEIEIDKSGMIEVEGVDERGRDFEVMVRQGTDSAASIDR